MSVRAPAPPLPLPLPLLLVLPLPSLPVPLPLPLLLPVPPLAISLHGSGPLAATAGTAANNTKVSITTHIENFLNYLTSASVDALKGLVISICGDGAGVVLYSLGERPPP